MTTDLRGLELSGRFYREVVRPLLEARFAGLRHAAALIGSGSEVLGFDDAMSTDHHWGLRLLLFLRDDEDARVGEEIDRALRRELPTVFLGHSTNFTPPDPNENGVRLPQMIDSENGSREVNHMVSITSVRGFFRGQLGYDLREPLEAADWLTFPMQKLRAVTAGAVYHDGIGHDEIGLEEARARFAWYPQDVWLYLLAAGWTRIGQEEHLMGRAGFVGDEIGAALIASRLVRDAMRLCFLMERVYAPYPKWFGTAFRRLACGEQLWPLLRAAQVAATWQEAEAALVSIYETLGRMHNRLRLTRPMPEQTRQFHGRPFRVMALHGFADALLAEIRDEAVRQIAARPLIGSIDLFSDNTDLLESVGLRRAVRGLYGK